MGSNINPTVDPLFQAERQLQSWSSGLPESRSNRLRRGGAFGSGRWSVGLALVSLVAVAPASRADESQVCAPNTDGATAIFDVGCCPGNVLEAYWPGRSPELNQTFCQLLMFPTTTTQNGDEFSQRIVDGSISSDSSRASAESMTLPSLWWNRDSLTNHLGGRRLVQSWLSYQIKDSATTVVDVVVNPQIWSVLTYNERFAVLNQFGTAARDFGYNLRFFQGNARSYRLVGLYACQFGPDPAETAALLDSPTCAANLDMTQIVQVQRSLVAEGERSQPAIAAPAQAIAAEGGL